MKSKYSVRLKKNAKEKEVKQFLKDVKGTFGPEKITVDKDIYTFFWNKTLPQEEAMNLWDMIVNDYGYKPLNW